MEKILYVKMIKKSENHVLDFLLNISFNIFNKKKEIGIYYNIEENGYYYRVDDTYSPLRKDLSRTIEMINDILSRLMGFNYQTRNKSIEISNFIHDIIRNYDEDQGTYLLVGSNGYDYNRLRDNLYDLHRKTFNKDKGRGKLFIETSYIDELVAFMQEELSNDTKYNIRIDELLDKF